MLGYDQATGFGLVQALAKLDLPALPLGDSTLVPLEEKVVVGGAGGRQRSVAARVVGKQEFAGYWEYVLDEAIFTAPAHPNWGGTAVIGPAGELIGIGSLQLERARERGPNEHLNMIVPIDDLKPILDDLLKFGRPNRPPRPWLGLYATEIEDKIVVVGLASRGPRRRPRSAPATSSWRSRAARSASLPPRSARCGRSAMPAWTCRSSSTAMAAPSR